LPWELRETPSAYEVEAARIASKLCRAAAHRREDGSRALASFVASPFGRMRTQRRGWHLIHPNPNSLS
jgi:hypothetical protein